MYLGTYVTHLENLYSQEKAGASKRTCSMYKYLLDYLHVS